MDTWSGKENPFAAAQSSPLAGNWNNYFANQLASRSSWKDIPAPYSYGPDLNTGYNFDYDPGGSSGSPYGPMSGLTNKVIDQEINNWLAREHPELFDFTQGVNYGGVAGAGNVAKDPSFGQFSKHPEVYAEIQSAANKYGVPANFLQAIIAKESSGDWDSNSMVKHARGMRIHAYVGVFENAARAWGFNFDSLIGNRAGQIEMLASGLRRFYDQLHAQNPSYGWANVAAYHYSGDPTMSYTPGDSYQHGTTSQYVDEALNWWKRLDAMAGNTWSNYTSTGQNTGVGSPQSQAWGQYAQYDQDFVGMAAANGAPANVLKALFRFGQERGANYSGNFDQNFNPVAETLASNYRAYGSWEKAIQATLGVSATSPAYTTIKGYWDQLNADMSGVFGGQTGGPMPTTQMEAVWGNVGYGVSQYNGEANDWTAAHPSMYDYGYGLGITNGGHPGMDIVFPRGTKLYAPLSGTVIIAGGTGSYSFYGNGRPGVGQLRIRLDNGDELILGHMMNITVREGDRVTPGMPVGVSGGDGSGDHLHLEYRKPDPSTSTGWRSVDPRAGLGGGFTGYNQGARTGLGYTQPLTFQNLMRAGASGQAIPVGATFVQGGGNSSWSNWLRNAMLGTDTTTGRSRSIDYGNLYSYAQ